MTSYLSGEEATHTDDAEDVKDGWAYDGPHAHITFGDEHPWGESEPNCKHTASIRAGGEGVGSARKHTMRLSTPENHTENPSTQLIQPPQDTELTWSKN